MSHEVINITLSEAAVISDTICRTMRETWESEKDTLRNHVLSKVSISGALLKYGGSTVNGYKEIAPSVPARIIYLDDYDEPEIRLIRIAFSDYVHIISASDSQMLEKRFEGLDDEKYHIKEDVEVTAFDVLESLIKGGSSITLEEYGIFQSLIAMCRK